MDGTGRTCVSTARAPWSKPAPEYLANTECRAWQRSGTLAVPASAEGKGEVVFIGGFRLLGAVSSPIWQRTRVELAFVGLRVPKSVRFSRQRSRVKVGVSDRYGSFRVQSFK